jgi:2-dehydro-3-deoxyphosphogluconate aldolase/(4S)-4-hydroxy-2-oxoglutarate aldolase
MIEQISKKHNITIGSGTVLDPETVRAAQLAGAEFIVIPTLNQEVIDACN